MHKIQLYEGLSDKIEKELGEIEKKPALDVQSLDALYKLATINHYIDKCMDRERGESYDSRRSYGRSYRYPDMMMPMSMDMEAFDNRRGRDADRDGRYSEDNFRYSQDRGRNSYENPYGYSRDAGMESMRMR